MTNGYGRGKKLHILLLKSRGGAGIPQRKDRDEPLATADLAGLGGGKRIRSITEEIKKRTNSSILPDREGRGSGGGHACGSRLRGREGEQRNVYGLEGELGHWVG